MSVAIENALTVEPTATKPPPGRLSGPMRFPARTLPRVWPASQADGQDILQRLMVTSFVQANVKSRSHRALGLRLVLAWLGDQPGTTWQERWLASGADTAAATWRQTAESWLHERDHFGKTRLEAMAEALPVVIAADVIRPSLGWLMGGTGGKKSMARHLSTLRDPEGFARLTALCESDPSVSDLACTQALYRCALILAAKGGTIEQITLGDVLELFDAQDEFRVSMAGGRSLLYRLLHQMGVFGAQAPTTLREARSLGQRTPEELLDRYQLTCRPVRDLLVDYLRERQPALDYRSLYSLANMLGKLFWADIEAHHPGISTLNLPRDVADAWKHRLRTTTKTITDADGTKTRAEVPRINYRECLTPVRAFYLDLACWAVEDPSRWSPWVAPCPVGEEEINRRKDKRHRKSRMDARTRERLPVLPVVVRSVHQQRTETQALLEVARRSAPGETFTCSGTTLVRSIVGLRSDPTKVWADDPATGKRRDLTREEDHAFWAWASVEVLRATGIRVEELTELSHHSLVQYRLPTTGELVPLLQILPSKTDAERLLVISPDLAEVFAAIILRIRERDGAVPLIRAYDGHERLWCAPAPRLFQHRIGTENRAITPSRVRDLLTDALTHTGLTDPVNDEPLHYTPHDFRRMFITDAILNGLPPHIAQVIAGHRDINVTLGYKAVYPQEAITAHLAFLARRRALRPSEEYRAPSDTEWQEFLGHFERRKVSTGTCARAFSTPCIHEHACVRCPMLWPDPQQRPRLVEIRDNLIDRIAEAEREGWHGEVEGLQISLAGAQDKLAQVDRRPTANIVNLGIPTRTPKSTAAQ